MSTYKELMERKSVRLFLDRPIKEDVLAKLYDAAIGAPSAGNQLLYGMIEVTDEKKRETLARCVDEQYWILKAPLIIVFVADHRRWLDLYRAYDIEAERPGLGDIWLALSDANIAAQNMVVCAQSLGLGSCYIGDVIEHYEEFKELLALPDEVIPACMLVIGYPQKEALKRPKPRRFAKEYVVYKDAYQLFSPSEHRHFYEERDKREGFDYKAAMKRFYDFKYGSDFSKEMDRSAALYFEPFLKK